MTKEPKHYYAFISYKREDKKEAKRLQHTLEYYRLPNKLRQENPDLPEYVRPVFRDMTDLEVGELSAQIHDALDQSHFLIVVCSPRSAKSQWVNDEIKYFISLGKQDKIIPYIIEGLPHVNNPDEECYPPALLALSKEKELLGANINEVGKDSAAIRVVSRMFNIRFDTLYKRYQRERRRRIFSIILAVIFIILSLFIFNFELHKKNNLIKEQYNNIILQEQRLREDSIIMASQMDSIVLRDSLISSQKDSILFTNTALSIANWKMLENQSRAIAEIANRHLEEGDIRIASLLALEVLPKDITHPNRPWTIEADTVLRKAANFIQLFGHTDRVRCAVFSPDGSKIASASFDSTICIWDVKKAELIHTIKGHTNIVQSVAFSPDNLYLASASYDGSVCIWDTQTWKMVRALRTEEDCDFFSVTYNRQGTLIAALCNSQCIHIWDAHTFEKLQVICDKNEKNLRSVAFNPQGDRIVATADSTIQTWDVGKGEMVTQMSGHKILANNAMYSPDGEMIASVGYDNLIRFWNADTGDSLFVLECPKIGIQTIDFSPDGRFLVSAYDDVIQIWDLKIKQLVRNIRCHSSTISFVQYSCGGNCIVSSSHDGTVTIWRDNQTYHKINREKRYIADKRKIKNQKSITYSQDSTYNLLAKDNIIYVYDNQTNQCKQRLCGLTTNGVLMNISPDNKRVVALNFFESLAIWDVQSGRCIYQQLGELEKQLIHHRELVNRSSAKVAEIYRNAAGKQRRILSLSFSQNGNDIIIEYSDAERIISIPDIQDVINQVSKHYIDRKLTSKERRKYYLE